MYTRIGGRSRVLTLAAVPLFLILSACGASKADSKPTVSVEEIFTSAAQTFDAQQATELALTPPTETPAPTEIATLPPLPSPTGPVATISFDTPTGAASSGTSGGTSGCDNAAWIADVTIPDGTKLLPNQNFKKTWTLFNSGTCTWDNTYQLGFVNGDKLNGAPLRVPVPVPPGQQINLSIDMQAPSSYGDYKGTWQMENAQNQFFGSQIWVSIKVRLADVTDTPTP